MRESVLLRALIKHAQNAVYVPGLHPGIRIAQDRVLALPPGAPGPGGEAEKGRGDDRRGVGRTVLDGSAGCRLAGTMWCISVLAQCTFCFRFTKPVFCTRLLCVPPCLYTGSFLCLEAFPLPSWQSPSHPSDPR